MKINSESLDVTFFLMEFNYFNVFKKQFLQNV